MTQSRTLKFRGKSIQVYPIGNGNYQDAEGTIYPKILFDNGYCGLEPFETGDWDPFHKRACKPHDQAFNRLQAGYASSTEGNLGTFANFSKAVLITMAESAYALLAGIPYIIVGGVGGIVRWRSLENK